jgi:hypothetical protein
VLPQLGFHNVADVVPCRGNLTDDYDLGGRQRRRNDAHPSSQMLRHTLECRRCRWILCQSEGQDVREGCVFAHPRQLVVVANSGAVGG